MGLGRWIKIHEVKKDLNAIKCLSPGAHEAIYAALQKVMVQLWVNFHSGVSA
jgi:hypothetical protein